MDRKTRARLFQLINEHTTAELAHATWSTNPSAPARASVARRRQTAVEELSAFVESLSAPDDLAIMRLREEVRLLNRAIERKNRKLKAQYRALHGGGPRTITNPKVVALAPFDTEIELPIVQIRANHGGAVVVVSPDGYVPKAGTVMCAAREKQKGEPR